MNSAFASYGMRVLATGSDQNSAFARLLVRAARAIREYRARLAAHELERLDDRLLADIGIDRGQINYVVRFGRR